MTGAMAGLSVKQFSQTVDIMSRDSRKSWQKW